MTERSLSTITVTTAAGLAELLADEVTQLGMTVISRMGNAVVVRGALTDAMRICLWSRLGHRVLWTLAERCPGRTPDELYRSAYAFPWEDWLSPDRPLCVTAGGDSEAGLNLRFLALKVKDAVVDRLRRTCGHRPVSGSDRTDSVVHVHCTGRTATFSLDAAGEPLSHRGYRLIPGPAPMRETLAAGCLIALGWNGETALSNPMCGSGTVAIEGVWIARDMAPGLLRERFGIESWRVTEPGLMQRMRHDARIRIRPPRQNEILASDLAPPMVRAARANARRAGVEQDIDWDILDFRRAQVPEPPGLIFMNPEYGLRLGADKDLDELYKAIGQDFKTRCGGHVGAVFTGNLRLAKQVGLKLSRKWTMFNGDVECRLLEFILNRATA